MKRGNLLKHRAFTLLQILATTAIIALLAGVSFGYLQRSNRSAKRAACDVHLKTLSLALDAFRQENGAYPLQLSKLTENKYITDASMMRCPLDPREDGSYAEYYVFRGARPAVGDTRDQSALPMIVCPFHEEDGGHGAQALRTGTKQYSAMKATLADSTGATVERPGKKEMQGRNGMTLYGGDRIRTTDGTAKILFADGSFADLQPRSDVTVLQSFIAGQQKAPLYTLVRQHIGEVAYRVNPGSKFDVVTPTATAGALGTKFAIKREGDEWYLRVTESRVLCNKEDSSGIYTPTMAPNGFVGSNWNLIGDESPSTEPTPTPTPAPTPTPTPTPAPGDDDDDNPGGGGGKGKGKGKGGDDDDDDD